MSYFKRLHEYSTEWVPPKKKSRLQRVIDAGLNIDMDIDRKCDRNGSSFAQYVTPFLYACLYCDLDTIRTLVRNGADFNKILSERYKANALLLAIENNRLDLYPYLEKLWIDKTDSHHDDVVGYSVWYCHLDSLKYFVKKNVVVNRDKIAHLICLIIRNSQFKRTPDVFLKIIVYLIENEFLDRHNIIRIIKWCILGSSSICFPCFKCIIRRIKDLPYDYLLKNTFYNGNGYSVANPRKYAPAIRTYLLQFGAYCKCMDKWSKRWIVYKYDVMLYNVSDISSDLIGLIIDFLYRVY